MSGPRHPDWRVCKPRTRSMLSARNTASTCHRPRQSLKHLRFHGRPRVPASHLSSVPLLRVASFGQVVTMTGRCTAHRRRAVFPRVRRHLGPSLPHLLRQPLRPVRPRMRASPSCCLRWHWAPTYFSQSPCTRRNAYTTSCAGSFYTLFLSFSPTMRSSSVSRRNRSTHQCSTGSASFEPMTS